MYILFTDVYNWLVSVHQGLLMFSNLTAELEGIILVLLIETKYIREVKDVKLLVNGNDIEDLEVIYIFQCFIQSNYILALNNKKTSFICTCRSHAPKYLQLNLK